MKIMVIYLLLAASCLISSDSIAQCDSRIRPANSYEIKYRERDNRCEGMYRSDVASFGFSIVGVIQGKFQYRLDRQEKLIVSSPFLQNQTVNIRAMALPLTTYYRMDAKIDQEDSLIWPVGDVLYQENLGNESIGVFGWIGKEEDKIYVPVKVTSEMRPSLEDSVTYIYLKASKDVKNVKWRFADLTEDSTCSASGPWIKPVVSRYSYGKKIIVNVPAQKKAPICITVTAEDQRTEGRMYYIKEKIILN